MKCISFDSRAFFRTRRQVEESEFVGFPTKLALITAAYAALLLLVRLIVLRVGDSSLVGALISYTPQLLFAVPLAVMFMTAVRSKLYRMASIHAIMALTFLFMFLDFHWASASGTRRHDIRVMTFSISKADQGVEGIIEVIKQEKPDVFCLLDADTLDLRGGVRHAIEPHLSIYDIRQKGQIIVGSRLPIVSQHSFPLPPNTSHRDGILTKVMVGNEQVAIVTGDLARVQLSKALNPVAFATHIRSTTESQRDQIQTLITHGKATGLPYILCGNFNRPPDGMTSSVLREELKDSFAEAGRGWGYTFPSILPAMRLDQIWISSGISAVDSRTCGYGTSGHLAYVADLAL